MSRLARSRWCLLLLALLLTACSASRLTRATVQSQLQAPDSVWAKALTPDFRGALAQFAGAPVVQSHLAYDPDSQRLTGTVEILLTNPANHTVPAVYMRTFAKRWGSGKADDFALIDLKVDGHPADFTVGETLITVKLPRPLRPGASTHLSYAVAVTLPRLKPTLLKAPQGGTDLSRNPGFYGVGPAFVGLSGLPVLLPVGEDAKETSQSPTPGFLGSAVLSLHELWLTVPAGWQVIASGKILETTQTKDGGETVHAVQAGRTQGLFVTKIGVKHTQQVGGLDVNLYVAPVLHKYSEPAMKDAVDALRTYVMLYGPVPVSTINIVALPMGNGLLGAYAGGGTLGIDEDYLQLASSLYHVPYTGANLLEHQATNKDLGLRRVIFHEIAHAWWGELVAFDMAKAPSLDEALANASLLAAFDRADGVDTGNRWRNYMSLDYELARLGGVPDAPLNLPPERYQSLTDEMILTYDKGGLFFDQLRTQVGDEKFFAAMRAYLSSHAYQTFATPGPISALMDEPGVQYLYNRWVEGAHGDEDIGVVRVDNAADRKLLGLPPT